MTPPGERLLVKDRADLFQIDPRKTPFPVGLHRMFLSETVSCAPSRTDSDRFTVLLFPPRQLEPTAGLLRALVEHDAQHAGLHIGEETLRPARVARFTLAGSDRHDARIRESLERQGLSAALDGGSITHDVVHDSRQRLDRRLHRGALESRNRRVTQRATREHEEVGIDGSLERCEYRVLIVGIHFHDLLACQPVFFDFDLVRLALDDRRQTDVVGSTELFMERRMAQVSLDERDS